MSILIVGIILFGGFLFGEIAAKLRLPRITGYILAGVLLSPENFHFVPSDFASRTDFITDLCLSFITFSVGGTLLLSRLKRLGKTILWISICEAEFAFLAVAVGFFLIAPFLLSSGKIDWTLMLALSLLIAALASPTDPSATLAVVHQYKSRGDVSSTIMGVAAFDDAFGIVNYSLATAIAGIIILHNRSIGISSFLYRALFIICVSILTGVVFGIIFNATSIFLQRETEGVLIVLIFAFLSLCFGVAKIFHLDELLATMAMGAIVVNFNKEQAKIFKMLERYTEELIFVLFFTLSGMHLNFKVLESNILLVLCFIIFRAVGKISGTIVGSSVSHASAKVRRYTGGGLIPQGGIVVGLALMMKQNPSFSPIIDIIISVIIGSTVIHEIIGPLLAKKVLEQAGEVRIKR